MGRNCTIEGFADAVSKELTEYVNSTSTEVKSAVKKVGDSVKEQIRTTAPKDTGRYAKSWDVRNVKETSTSLEVSVYSGKHYQLTHLLEFGHAKRGGGRTKAQPHIEPAEKAGFDLLLKEVEKGVKG